VAGQQPRCPAPFGPWSRTALRRRQRRQRLAPAADAAAPAGASNEVWEGVCAGKYAWASGRKASRRPADAELVGEAITRYSWADGRKTVSVYVDLPGLDAVGDDQLSCEGSGRSASLTIAAVGTPPKKRRLALSGLAHDIEGARCTRKPGKDTAVLRLQKKEELPWSELLRGKERASGSGEEEEEPAFSGDEEGDDEQLSGGEDGLEGMEEGEEEEEADGAPDEEEAGAGAAPASAEAPPPEGAAAGARAGEEPETRPRGEGEDPSAKRPRTE